MTETEFLNSLLPVMTEEEQAQMLSQLVEMANKDSMEQAIIDPLSLGSIQLN